MLKDTFKTMNDSSYIPVDGGVCAPRGFLGSAVSCGIKKPTATRLDLALIYSTEPCVSAGTFTTNRVQAACVKVSREHLRKGNIRAIVANSGNANACTRNPWGGGRQGRMPQRCGASGAEACRSGRMFHRRDWPANAYDAHLPEVSGIGGGAFP